MIVSRQIKRKNINESIITNDYRILFSLFKIHNAQCSAYVDENFIIIKLSTDIYF